MATEVRAQLAEHSLPSPKGEPNLEKKSGCQPRRHGDSGPQKEPMIPGIVDFKLIQEAVRTSKPQTPSAYRFGRLSHHSFFSRHHPQPQHVTHIQDLTGKPVCVVRDELSLATSPQATLLSRYLIRMPTISVPVGDPQSNRDPRLYSEGGASAGTGGKVLSRDWQAHPCFYPSHGPPPLPPGPKPACKQRWRRPDLCPTGSGAADPGTAFANSADRLLECYPVLATLRARQGERHGTRAPADRGGSAPSPAPSAHPSRKTPEPAPGSSRLTSREAPATLQGHLPYLPARPVTQLAVWLQPDLPSCPCVGFSQSPKKMKTPPLPKSEKPENIGKAQVLRVHSSQNPEEKAAKAEG
ncbi:protein TBATA isoform X2 [Bubalus bubalis]|uniref:protein TBATA isoform X2 n=1 Tax=Bubalus bubalis TaxID=89462 RepID=UPI000DBC6FA3|nr:protein TBATA isoform X2 [Bubalus bubalis]